MSSILFKNATFFHSSSFDLIRRGSILVSRDTGLITKINNAADNTTPNGIPNGSVNGNNDHANDGDVLEVECDGYLVLPGFVDAGIVAEDSDSAIGLPECLRGSLKQNPSTLTNALSVALSTGTTTAALGTSFDQTLSTIAGQPQLVSFHKVDSEYVCATSPKIRLTPSSSPSSLPGSYTLVSPQSSKALSGSGNLLLNSTSRWSFLHSATTQMLQERGAVDAQSLVELLKRVTQDPALALGMQTKGVIQEGFAGDMILVNLNRKVVGDTVQDILTPLFLSPQTALNAVDAVIIASNVAYSRPDIPLSQSLASVTLNAYYKTVNVPPSTIEETDASKGFDSIESALDAIRAGDFVIVVDNEDRENEGDLILAAEDATPDKMAFMIRYTSGVICVPLTGERLDDLGLPLMVERNEDLFKTAYTISVDLKDGTTTGISSYDRALTVKALSNPSMKKADFNRPGHIFPLRAQPGGVLTRVGHTEASVDLARLAGKQPAAAICEITKDEGGMMRRDELLAFGKKWGLKVVTIDALVKYRLKHGI
ncbi:hypothetical protein HDV05_007462 [Chytridiales sp. JEL 0842]|nr:hypothetical protein HDV05_007462 [Chytridiales sp. JEL 0842]